MDKHIPDYNFLISILPETKLWDKIILTMDNATLSNFYCAFPAMIFLDSGISIPEYIGNIQINKEFKAETLICMIYLEATIPIYRVKNCPVVLQLNNTTSYLLIKGKQIILSEEPGDDYGIEKFWNHTGSQCSLDKFIIIVEKYRYITEDFITMILDLHNIFSDTVPTLEDFLTKIGDCIPPNQKRYDKLNSSDLIQLQNKISGIVSFNCENTLNPI